MGDGLKLVTNNTGSALYYQPRGGCNPDGIGSNCTLLVSGIQQGLLLKGDAILIDFGVHPMRWTPTGITQSFPDIRDILSPESPARLRAIFLTHAHADHDEAILRYVEGGHPLPPVYGSRETLEHLRNKLRSITAGAPWPELREIAAGESVTDITGFEKIEAVSMGHTRPALGYLASAAGRSVFISADFKLDQTTLLKPTDLARLQQMGERKEVDLLCLDSTRAAQDGFVVPETQVRATRLALAEQFPNHRLNMIISGHNDEAIAGAAWLASKTGRFLVHHGKVIETALRILNNSPHPVNRIVQDDDLQVFSGRAGIVKRMSPSHVLNVLSGANGEKQSSFARTSRGENDYLSLGPEDVVILCASIRPWNRTKVDLLLTQLRAQGVEHVFINSNELPLHASGHEHGGGLESIARLVQPKCAVTGLHGSTAQREALCVRFNSQSDLPLALQVDNGQTLRLDENGISHTPLVGPALITTVIRPAQKTAANKASLRRAA